ncbi:MAG: hypothetical protein LBV69_09970 [Bacteroidales bacterium]|jgi:hypothetical protein|nr:hypothetical protein [Bacteroidales bacterium]
MTFNKKILIIILISANFQNLHSQKNYELKLNNKLYYRDSLQLKGNYAESIKQNLKILDTVSNKTKLLYNIAINYSILNQTDSAFYYLNMFLDSSEDDKMVIVDKGFENLQKDTFSWNKIINKIENRYLILLDSSKNKEVALQLFYMIIYDQIDLFLYAQGIRDGDKNSIFVDSLFKIKWQNYPKLEKIISEFGFPTISKVGRYASNAAFLTLQHAPIWHYPKKYYKMVQTAFYNKDFDSISYAMLTDRWLMHHNKKQIWGTQWYFSSKNQKKYPDKILLHPVKDFKNLNKRRKEMGFKETIEEYANNRENHYILPEFYKGRSKWSLFR